MPTFDFVERKGNMQENTEGGPFLSEAERRISPRNPLSQRLREGLGSSPHFILVGEVTNWLIDEDNTPGIYRDSSGGGHPVIELFRSRMFFAPRETTYARDGIWGLNTLFQEEAQRTCSIEPSQDRAADGGVDAGEYVQAIQVGHFGYEEAIGMVANYSRYVFYDQDLRRLIPESDRALFRKPVATTPMVRRINFLLYPDLRVARHVFGYENGRLRQAVKEDEAMERLKLTIPLEKVRALMNGEWPFSSLF